MNSVSWNNLEHFLRLLGKFGYSGLVTEQCHHFVLIFVFEGVTLEWYYFE